ncbi:hypothetical protein FQA39_LY04605 [Lamprigera yunnana]|nr:hypothetical protein FQA39_LY04605 [Lamprigera yunnana]
MLLLWILACDHRSFGDRKGKIGLIGIAPYMVMTVCVAKEILGCATIKWNRKMFQVNTSAPLLLTTLKYLLLQYSKELLDLKTNDDKPLRQFKTIQERINEKWEKKYEEVDCKMVEKQEQVDNNNGQINGICERLREQGTKLINVEAKVNQDKEDRVQVCEDLKEQNREIVNYIEEKIKIGNGIGHNVTINYKKIEKEAPKFHSSKNEHRKVFVQELQTYLEVIKRQIGNQYDQSMEAAEAMRGETETRYKTKLLEEKIDERTIFHILPKKFEEEIHNKVMIDKTKNFDDLVKILKTHDKCEWGRKRVDGNKYYNRSHNNNYQNEQYNQRSHERDNYRYTLGPSQRNQFCHNNNNNRNQRFQDNRRWTTETDNRKMHLDIENRQGREEMKEPLKDMILKTRIIDQVEEM